MLKKKLFGMMTLIVAVMLVFSLVACGDDGDGNGGGAQTVTYIGYAGTEKYTLKITEDTARYAAQTGDAYELSVGSKKSTGTVNNVSGSVLTLAPSSGSTFTATVSGTNITAMSGTITYDGNGGTETAPATLAATPSGSGSGFSISGYPTATSGMALYVSSNANITDLNTLNLNFVGLGTIDLTGNVTWTLTPPNGTYTLYIVRSPDEITMKTTSTVTITNGNGTVAYSAFADINGNSNGNAPKSEYPEAEFPALTGASDFIGIWKSVYTLQFRDDGTWASNVYGFGEGRFLVSGNSVYIYRLESGKYYQNSYGVRSGTTITMDGGLAVFAETWTKQN
jgi:uncharacterized lipoprotein YehR (DUF1307 family)